jgi:hypothetical protein
VCCGKGRFEQSEIYLRQAQPSAKTLVNRKGEPDATTASEGEVSASCIRIVGHRSRIKKLLERLDPASSGNIYLDSCNAL